jgi:enhancing lycopene biosynthesis protein 2
MLAGEILSIEGGALTLEDQSGSEIQVHVTDTTLIQKQAEVSVNDLQEGETVLVSGSQEADGSITARMVQVSSADGLGMPGGFPPGGQSGSAPANP